LTTRSLNFIRSKNRSNNFIVIDFENFVLEPELYINRISQVFKLEKSKIIKILKSENIPRRHINSSVQKNVYKRYYSSNLSTELSHKEDYIFLKNQIKSQVSENIWEEFGNFQLNLSGSCDQ
jgi:hypothetical protein